MNICSTHYVELWNKATQFVKFVRFFLLLSLSFFYYRHWFFVFIALAVAVAVVITVVVIHLVHCSTFVSAKFIYANELFCFHDPNDSINTNEETYCRLFRKLSQPMKWANQPDNKQHQYKYDSRSNAHLWFWYRFPFHSISCEFILLNSKSTQIFLEIFFLFAKLFARDQSL